MEDCYWPEEPCDLSVEEMENDFAGPVRSQRSPPAWLGSAAVAVIESCAW